MSKSEILTDIANSVIKLMETEGVNWTKPWTTTTKNHGQPISIYKKEYSGINRFNLGMIMSISGYQSPVFATFKKWKEVGATVKKGMKGHKAIFFKTIKIKDKQTDETKNIPMLKTYYLFNADQVEGWEGDWLTKPEGEEQVQDWNDVDAADMIVNSVGAKIDHKEQDKAFYMPSTDAICMPLKKQFKNDSGYYGTMFHELVHWTGAKSRLDRKFGIRFGDDSYAKEELIAELGGAMLSGISRVDATPRADHARYLNGWIKGLKEQPKMIMTAASNAEKAAQYILTEAVKNNEEITKLIAA